MRVVVVDRSGLNSAFVSASASVSSASSVLSAFVFGFGLSFVLSLGFCLRRSVLSPGDFHLIIPVVWEMP